MRTLRLSLKSRRALLGLAFISPWLLGFIFLLPHRFCNRFGSASATCQWLPEDTFLTLSD